VHPLPAVRACDQAGRAAGRLRPGGQTASGLTNLPPGPGWGAFSYRCAGECGGVQGSGSRRRVREPYGWRQQRYHSPAGGV
jgi:hypothetical protein